MSTINDRIAACVESVGMTKTAFANKLGLSQPFVSNLCSGATSPSDRTVRDICDKFGINESWLRTGEGEMMAPTSRDDQITDFAANILKNEDDSFKRRFVAMLSRLDESDWAVLEKMVLVLSGENKKD